jgi:heat shock protein HtpX
MNYLKTTMLMALLTGMLLVIGNFAAGSNGMLIALVMAGIMNFVSYWFSDKIVLAMYRAQPVDAQAAPMLYRVVEKLTKANNMPMPKVFIIPTESPNAFATGRNPKHAAVAATQGILKILNENELEGVMAHELAHVRNRDILTGSIVATMAGAITYLAHMAQWGMRFTGRDDNRGGNIVGSILMVIVAPIAAMLIQMAISRSREYAADAAGAKMSGKALGLASALDKLHRGAAQIPMQGGSPSTAHMFIVNPFKGGLMSLFSTHPPAEERIRRLREIAGQQG